MFLPRNTASFFLYFSQLQIFPCPEALPGRASSSPWGRRAEEWGAGGEEEDGSFLCPGAGQPDVGFQAAAGADTSLAAKAA